MIRNITTIAFRLRFSSTLFNRMFPATHFNFSKSKLVKEYTNESVQSKNQNQLENKIESNQHLLGALQFSPFYVIPKSFIYNYEKYTQIDDQSKKDIIALKLASDQINQNDIKRTFQILLPYKQLHVYGEEIKNPKIVYEKYFQNRVKQYFKIIQNPKSQVKQILKSFNIINKFRKPYWVQNGIKLPQQKLIISQKQHGAIVAQYINFCIKFELEYSHILPLLMQKLQSTSLQQRYQIVQVILGIKNFQNYFSQKIIKMLFQIIQANLNKIIGRELFYVIRQIYNLRNKNIEPFIKNIIDYITKNHLNLQFFTHNISLIIKLVQFSNKQGVSNTKILNFILQNINQLKKLVNNNSFTQGIFFSLAFLKFNTRKIPQQYSIHLKKYFINYIQLIKQLQQVEQGQLLRYLKLLNKHFWILNPQQKIIVYRQLNNYILPNFNQQNQVLFYSILVILRQKVQSKQSGSKQHPSQINKYIISYLKKNTKKNQQGKLIITQNINAIIQLLYQIQRHHIQIDKRYIPLLTSYDFSPIQTLKLQSVSYFFTYLYKSNQDPKAIINTIQQVQNTFIIYIRKKYIKSIKILLVLINLLEKISYEDELIYKFIQNGFSNLIINNQNFVIQIDDLKFIEQKMIKRGYGSFNLKKFIRKSIIQPNNLLIFKKQYAIKEQQFINKIKQKDRTKYKNSKNIN